MESSERSLVRGIGRWDLVGIFINGVVGAGIFLMMVSTSAEAIAFAAILVLGAGLGGLYAIRRQA